MSQQTSNHLHFPSLEGTSSPVSVGASILIGFPGLVRAKMLPLSALVWPPRRFPLYVAPKPSRHSHVVLNDERRAVLGAAEKWASERGSIGVCDSEKQAGLKDLTYNYAQAMICNGVLSFSSAISGLCGITQLSMLSCHSTSMLHHTRRLARVCRHGTTLQLV